MIVFACPHCSATLRVDESLTGRTGPCPSCSRTIRAPEADPSASSDASASGGRGSGQRTLHPPAAEDTAFPELDSSGLAPNPDYPFLAPAEQADEMGRLGSYRVLSVLGTGAMGVVFEAEDAHLRRRVALKVMKPTLAASPEYHRRFLREARLTAAIDHENIVTVYQVGEDRGIPFLAMQLLRGQTLEQRLQRAGGRLPLPEVLRIGQEIAAGLAAAHAQGLIHRDIKPANIWLEEGRGRVRIVDFGLARGTEADAHFTHAGSVIGTPAFMAPEQASGASVDSRCDLFSLGAVLYVASTGKSPFPGRDTLSVLSALATQTPAAPHRVVPDLPRMFSALVMRLLAKDPADRPQTALEVAAAIDRLERGETTEELEVVSDEPPSPKAPTTEEPRHKHNARPGKPLSAETRINTSPRPRSGGEGSGVSGRTTSRADAKRARVRHKHRSQKTGTDWSTWILIVGAVLLIAALVAFVLVLIHRAG